MAYQKGRIVDDGVRAKVYGILRIPLNCFVVIALSLTQEGEFCFSARDVCVEGRLLTEIQVTSTETESSLYVEVFCLSPPSLEDSTLKISRRSRERRR